MKLTPAAEVSINSVLEFGRNVQRKIRTVRALANAPWSVDEHLTNDAMLAALVDALCELSSLVDYVGHAIMHIDDQTTRAKTNEFVSHMRRALAVFDNDEE